MKESDVATPDAASDSKRRPRQSAFARYIGSAASTAPALPLVHTTNALCLREIAERGEMTPHPCNVFANESLLYFFYGKPAYRLFADYDSALTAEAPIALILSADLARESKRLFPFDSGGFERYRRFMPKQFELPHFELAPNNCLPGQIVTTFFRSNAEYFDGQPRSELAFPADQFEMESFSELLQFKGKDALDDRAWTIELQVATRVELSGATVLAVVIPSNLIDTDLGRNISADWKARMLTYNLSGRGKPSEYHVAVRDLTRRFLGEEGYL